MIRLIMSDQARYILRRCKINPDAMLDGVTKGQTAGKHLADALRRELAFIEKCLGK